jgi:hypothetical protein
VSLGWQRKLAPGVTITVGGAGESSTLAEFVFGASPGLTLTGQSNTLAQLSGGVTGQTIPGGVAASPLSLTLFGARRRDGAFGTTLTVSQSPRVTWRFSTSVMRDFPSASAEPTLTGGLVYPGVTKGLVSAGLTYSLSRRTEIGLEADYARTFSAYDRIQIGSATAAIDRVLARQWFVHLRAGYGALAELQTAVPAPIRREYHGDAGIGAKLREHTFLATVSRGIADSYGLGAANTTGGEIAWIWHRPSGNWTLQSSASYERLAGGTIRTIQGWLYQATVLRQITRQTSFAIQAVYATDSGRLSAGGFTSLMRRGVRMTIAWTPGVTRSR